MPSRRHFHQACLSSLIAASIGCPNQSANQSQDDAASTLDSQAGRSGKASSVPLRLWLAGSPSDADAIRRGWASVSSQQLDIDVLPIQRLSGTANETPSNEMTGNEKAGTIREADLERAADSSDMILGPSILLADWIGAKAIVPMADDATAKRVEAFFPAIRSGICRYAAQRYCLPLGSPIASLISAEPIESCDDWDAYDQRVQAWNGEAAEPTAPGWAAMTFLWRASRQVTRWLFDQKSFESLIATADYVDVLHQMKLTCQRSNRPGLTPQQIAARIQSGDLKGGIGFPANSDMRSTSALSFQPLPGQADSDSVLLDPMSPVIALSANCRQSTASKAFMLWITGGEGSDATRSQLESAFPVSPISNMESASSPAAASATSAYGSLLESELFKPITETNFMILEGHRYYAALDQAVLDCLAGRSSAETALQNANKQWDQLTERIGVKAQTRAWRRAKGMRA